MKRIFQGKGSITGWIPVAVNLIAIDALENNLPASSALRSISAWSRSDNRLSLVSIPIPSEVPSLCLIAQ